jgi:hypothetical protein
LPLGAKIFFVLWWSMLMFGMFMSWYKPWFFGPTQKELDLYQAIFAGTHSILPGRLPCAQKICVNRRNLRIKPFRSDIT